MGELVKYSVDEIDRMRDFVRRKITASLIGWHTSDHLEAETENQLRTYMGGGITPDEMELAAIQAEKRGWPDGWVKPAPISVEEMLLTSRRP